MPRTPRPGAAKKSPEWRARVAAGVRRAAERRRTATASALRTMRRSGEIAPALAPFADLAADELAEWIAACGGAQRISPMRRALLEDAALLGVPMRAEIARFLARRDTESATRAATLANSRRAGLIAAGLDPPEPDAIDLHHYLDTSQTAQDRAGDEIEPDPGSRVKALDDRGPASERHAKEAEGLPLARDEGGCE